jgi:cytochrome b6-f complex iron-sulfur subunit
MTPDPVVARRTALLAGLSGAGALALAACSSSAAPGGSATSAATPPASSPATPPATSPTRSSVAGSDTGSGAAEAKIISLDDIPDNGSASGTADGKPVLLYRTGNSVVCFSAICTHQGCTVNPDGAKFACPCHGSMYDAKTGKVLAGPAPAPLPQVAVRVSGGDVVAGGTR